MELATTEEVGNLIQALTDASGRYDPAISTGTASRMDIIAAAQALIAGLTQPSDIGHVYLSRVCHTRCHLSPC
jgi:hypothetical protein